MRTSAFLLLLLTGLGSLLAQPTNKVYLSGTGFDHTVPWKFYCTAGMKSGDWTTIGVPSCWEQQGFGEYHYGHDPFDNRLKEEGHYRLDFEAPGTWKGNHIRLVFEGVMTDCRVMVNGKQAGPVHQGGFYRFGYDISGLLKYGRENTLEVFVKKFSDNISVNEAERKADYWVFGGIYRPVYLEISPKEHISKVAVDPKADGSLNADVQISGLNKSRQLEVRVLEQGGTEMGSFVSEIIPDPSGIIHLSGSISGAKAWTPETPTLYEAEFRLLDQEGKILHQVSERIGFRTVEVREQDGIYVNGTRIKFKGVNRHSFHPDHGRTSSKAYSIEAVNLIKDMNMNAVRMSHYPPDPHFLDVCDSLGLFVLDELAGWQRPPYDSVVGRRLLKEMIDRDVNHPSVVMWDNGNEGGWNTAYDDDFKELDIQKREVNHPWGAHEKTNTAHYVEYDYLAMDHFAPRQIFFPTEVIHGLYDGGHGAGLEDFWLRMWNHPLAAGAFLWVFADEAVRRTDTGELDTDGNHAPDGILGPYHEKEGSFYAIREIWSPVYIEKRYITPGFNGTFQIENRFHYTGLEACSFSYGWVRLSDPGTRGSNNPESGFSGEIMDSGIPVVDPLHPGQAGLLQVPLPADWKEADLLYLEAYDPYGRLIHRWSWPVNSPENFFRERIGVNSGTTDPVNVSDTPQSLVLESSGVELEIDKENGTLKEVRVNGQLIPLSGGPMFREDAPPVQQIRHFDGNRAHHVVVELSRENRLEWIMHPGGMIDMKLQYHPENGRIPFTGASFSYPEDQIQSVTYMGNGPYRVWKNRTSGVVFNVWEKQYNNTITGHSGYIYPEFKGYYSNLYWSRFTDNSDRSFTVYSKTEDLYLRLFTPEEAPDPARTHVNHPAGDLSFMLGIPAIGTKFKDPEQLGPQSTEYYYLNRRVKNEALTIWLTFDFLNDLTFNRPDDP